MNLNHLIAYARNGITEKYFAKEDFTINAVNFIYKDGEYDYGYDSIYELIKYFILIQSKDIDIYSYISFVEYSFRTNIKQSPEKAIDYFIHYLKICVLATKSGLDITISEPSQRHYYIRDMNIVDLLVEFKVPFHFYTMYFDAIAVRFNPKFLISNPIERNLSDEDKQNIDKFLLLTETI